MAWKRCEDIEGITFGSIIRDTGGILITTFDKNTFIEITRQHQFHVRNLCISSSFELWEFDTPIETTSVLKLIQEMVSND